MANRRAARARRAARVVRRLSATELARRLSDVLNRVHFQGETVIVERGDKPLCLLTPVPGPIEFQLSDLVALLDSLPLPGKEWSEAVEQRVVEQGEFQGFK